MHVAYIHQHFATRKGTTGTRSYEMSQRLIRAGHRVTMVCGAYAYEPSSAKENQRYVREYQLDGIRVVRVAEPYGNEMSFRRRLLAFGRFARAAKRIVSALDAELVFASSTPLTVGIPGMKAARNLGVPFVFEVRDPWPELPIAMGILHNPVLIWYARRMERRIYAAADHIVALAPGVTEGIAATGYPRERISLVPNSADVELFKPGAERHLDSRFGSDDEFRLVFTGAHGMANGLDAVLNAAAELQRRGARGVRFVFIGSGSQRERLIRRSQAEGLAEMVSWLDPVPKEDLARILPRFDVGMMILQNVPDFYRCTSPNKFFDYLASGLPVLNNYPGWVAELIREHRCGIAVPPDDPGAFADAVLRLAARRDELKVMGLRARSLAETQFSRDILGEQFVRVLEEVCAGRPGGQSTARP